MLLKSEFDNQAQETDWDVYEAEYSEEPDTGPEAIKIGHIFLVAAKLSNFAGNNNGTLLCIGASTVFYVGGGIYKLLEKLGKSELPAKLCETLLENLYKLTAYTEPEQINPLPSPQAAL